MMRRSDNWLEHAFQQARWQPQRQVVALAALGFFIALILGALYLSQVASEATTNRRLADLWEVRDELERTNEQLRAEIASLESVPALQARAIELGFAIARQDQIEYLPVDGYNPIRLDTVAPLIAEDENTPIYDETFTDWVQQQWNELRDSLNGLVGEG